MRVRLLDASPRPLDTVAAAARTCYSPDLVTAEQVAADGVGDPEVRHRAIERRNRLARSVLEAGHLTTWQHTHLHFAIEGISRLALWCFLHAHPFYNSEQVSQRYVPVDRAAVRVPRELDERTRRRFFEAVDAAHTAYHELTAVLEAPAEARILRARPSWGRPVHRKRLERARLRAAREVARMVLPLATTANLHHTVSLLTVLRYLGSRPHPDAREEIAELQAALRWEVVRVFPELEPFLPGPADPGGGFDTGPFSNETRREFDTTLGGRTTVLLPGTAGLEAELARAVRTVLSRSREALSDAEAVRLVLDPSRNRLLASTLGLTTMDPVLRTLQQVHVRFATRLSHAADSQNQRHRMVPGARPILAGAADGDPDYAVPSLVAGEPRALEIYRAAMERAWEAAGWLRWEGPDPATALTLLPNALNVRIIESSDLAAFHHKMRMRLCWNAQEEIRRIAWEQAMQVAEAAPEIGRFLLPPCSIRKLAGVTPYCPEGDRFCGTPVWKLALEDQGPDLARISHQLSSRGRGDACQCGFSTKTPPRRA